MKVEIKNVNERISLKSLPRNVWAVGFTSFFMDISSDMVINLVPLFLANVLGVQTNIIGVYHGSRTALHYFNNQNSGKLINILGLGDSWAAPWQNTYAASKAWMRSYTKALAAENKGSGVSIIAFNPGMTRTSLLTEVDVIEGSEERLKVFPLIVRMWSNPPEVPAEKIAWLASAATDGRTGLYVSLVRPGFVLRGLWKELMRSITGNHAGDVVIHTNTVTPHRG